MEFKALRLPFRMILTGSSGCGKSTFLSGVIRNINKMISPAGSTFSAIRIYYQILSPDLTDLLLGVPNLELKAGIPSQQDVDDLTGDHTLWIVEDAMTEIRNSKTVAQILTRVSSHCSLSVCITVQNLFDKGVETRNITLSATHFILFRSVRDNAMLRSLNNQLMWPRNFLPAAMSDCNARDRFAPLIINLTPQWDDSCRVYTGLLPGQDLFVYGPPTT